jgi:hypothetical protein
MNFDIYLLAKQGPYSSILYYRSYSKIGNSYGEKWTVNPSKASVWVNKSVPKRIKKALMDDNEFLANEDLIIMKFRANYQSEEY